MQNFTRPHRVIPEIYPRNGIAQVFISQSFDATTHFETAIADVMVMYKRITGSELVLTDGQQLLRFHGPVGGGGRARGEAHARAALPRA